MSAGRSSDSAVIDSRYKPACQRETLGGSTSGLTQVSAGDAMAALPRKWVSGGLRLVAYASESAPTLPFDARAQSVSWESMRLPRQCHSRSRRPCSLLRAAARFENLGSSDSAVIDSRYKAAQDRLAEILTAACAAREELLPESAIHRPASRRRGQRVVNSIHEDALQKIH